MTDIRKNNDICTQITTVKLPPDNQQEALNLMIERARFMTSQPGFVSINLHRSKDGSHLINYIQWTSPEKLKTSTKSRFLMEWALRFCHARPSGSVCWSTTCAIARPAGGLAAMSRILQMLRDHFLALPARNVRSSRTLRPCAAGQGQVLIRAVPSQTCPQCQLRPREWHFRGTSVPSRSPTPGAGDEWREGASLARCARVRRGPGESC